VSFAKVVISGMVTSEPEKRFTPNNHAVTSFNLSVENPVLSNKPGAVSEPFTIKVTCWRNLAEAVPLQLHQGDAVLAEGRLLINTVQGPDGVQKKVFEVDANSIDKLPGKPEPIIAIGGTEGQQQSSAAPLGGGYAASTRAAAPAYEASFTPARQTAAPTSGSSAHFSSEDLLTEDDIPF
jgi:single-strand DNA-binding protein